MSFRTTVCLTLLHHRPTQIESDPIAVFNYRGSACHLSNADQDSPFTDAVDLDPQWHIPSEGEVDFANELLEQFLEPAVAQLARLREGTGASEHTTEQIVSMTNNALHIVSTVCRLGPHVMHEAELPVDTSAPEFADVVRWRIGVERVWKGDGRSRLRLRCREPLAVSRLARSHYSPFPSPPLAVPRRPTSTPS